VRTLAGAAPMALAFVAIGDPSPSGLGSRLAGRPSGPRRLLGLEGGAFIGNRYCDGKEPADLSTPLRSGRVDNSF
jgi:hypothetical protein